MMVKYCFDFNDFVAAMKLVKQKAKPLGKPLSKVSRVAITKQNGKLCSLKVGALNQLIDAEITGKGTIEISIILLLKILSTYKGSKLFTIEAISDSQSLINGTFKMNTVNYSYGQVRTKSDFKE